MTQTDPQQAEAIVSRYREPGAAVVWAMRGLAVVALAVSGFLLYEALAAGRPLPGCGPGSGCAEVLRSGWSRWLGVPVAGPATVVYAVLLAATLHVGRTQPTGRRRIAWMVLLIGAATAAGAATWFVIVQAAWLGAWCRYCLLVHGSGLALAALVAWAAPVGRRRILAGDPPDPMLIAPPVATLLVLVGLLPVGALAAGQLLWPEPTTRVQRLGGTGELDTGPGPDRTLSVLGGKVRLSPHQYPTLGSPDAPVIMAYLFDYTCPTCRHVHGLLEGARDRYGDQLGIVALPTPLDADCNPLVEETEPRHEYGCELATLALAVWRADPAKFAAFDRWLFEPELPPTPAAARAKAVELIGEAALNEALASPWVRQQVPRNATLYQLAEGGALPLLIVGSTTIQGRPGTAEDLYDLLETQTPLEGE